MITTDDIAAKAARAYMPFLRAWLRGEPFTPLDLPAGAPPTDFRALERAVATLLHGAKDRRGFGYTVELQTRATRAHSSQSLPTRIRVPTADDMLLLIGKTAEFNAFAEDVALIRATLPALEPWLEANPQHVIEQHGVCPELLRICAYFCANPRPNLYIRELPITVHTKFIEQRVPMLTRLLDALLPAEAVEAGAQQFEQRYGLRYDLPLIRIRLLDEQLRTRLRLPLMDLAATATQLAMLPCASLRCVIVENKMVFLTLPQLPDTLAIFGSGFQVELLAKLPWLRECPIWYWGDLDAQGFQILARLRALFPQVVSLMMDDATFDAFREFSVVGTPTTLAELPQLTPGEQAMFEPLVPTNLRLEQERISHGYVLQQLELALQGECTDSERRPNYCFVSKGWSVGNPMLRMAHYTSRILMFSAVAGVVCSGHDILPALRRNNAAEVADIRCSDHHGIARGDRKQRLCRENSISVDRANIGRRQTLTTKCGPQC
jgi:hypothetical protein